MPELVLQPAPVKMKRRRCRSTKSWRLIHSVMRSGYRRKFDLAISGSTAPVFASAAPEERGLLRRLGNARSGPVRQVTRPRRVASVSSYNPTALAARERCFDSLRKAEAPKG
jgi:hypothetical protein